jgi:hypothetical protein
LEEFEYPEVDSDVEPEDIAVKRNEFENEIKFVFTN